MYKWNVSIKILLCAFVLQKLNTTSICILTNCQIIEKGCLGIFGPHSQGEQLRKHAFINEPIYVYTVVDILDYNERMHK